MGKVFIFLVIALVLEPALLVAKEQKSPATQCSKSLRLLKKTVAVLGIGTALVFAPSVYHSVEAAAQNKEHIGHGIYFSMKEVIASLSNEEKKLLESPKENTLAIAELFNQKLTGSYQASLTILPRSRDALSYFSNHPGTRGACRHKAIILSTILNHLGIKAQLQWIKEPKTDPHMWLYLPEVDLIADPTQGIIMKSSEYYETEVPAWEKTFLKSSNWTLTPFENGWFR